MDTRVVKNYSNYAHRIRMYAIYGNIYHQYTPVMLASIYHTWIRHGMGFKTKTLSVTRSLYDLHSIVILLEIQAGFHMVFNLPNSLQLSAAVIPGLLLFQDGSLMA